MIKNNKQNVFTGSSHHGAAEMNLTRNPEVAGSTRNPEVAGSIPGLAQ